MTTTTTTPTTEAATEALPQRTILQLVGRFVRPAIGLTILFTILLGIFYPLAITGLAQAFFPSQANGSLVYKNGQPIASAIIGQDWTQPQYFHGRPSATTYAADSSGGSNLGPTNSALLTEVQKNTDLVRKENPDVPDTTPIPVDMVTSSASGIDPDISVAAAYYQIARVAKARSLTQDQVRALIDSHIQGRFLGIFGEPRLNVLALNQALDKAQGK
ncbi:MAG: potassium-transporting ATPase subunit KdpC [Ktedonobacterales bacterium]|nr:potassium-transporting ATPase subunit KdpC [Ktedonobacterales bacterium]